jgi:hypothetical protein
VELGKAPFGFSDRLHQGIWRITALDCGDHAIPLDFLAGHFSF